MIERGGFPLGRLLVITAASFASVWSEALPIGIIPRISDDLGVSESAVGQLVTVFALTVVASTIPLTMLTRNVPRKSLMVATLFGLALANVACALAPTFGVLVVARVFGGLCHALFWAVTAPYAARLVRPDQLSRALSVTNLGGTLAFILGLPASTTIGVAVGWRAAFGVMGGAVAALAILVVLLLPPVEHRVPLGTGEVAVAAHRDPALPGVLLVASIALLFVAGQNVLSTYIAPWLIGPGGIPELQIGAVLFGYGLAGLGGIAAAGVLGDRRPHAALVGSILGVGAATVLLALIGRGPIAVLLILAVWSASYAAWPALITARILHAASPRLRDLAGALISMSFNTAIAGGAIVGGLVLDGFGVASLPWVQTMFCGATLLVVLVGLFWLPARRRPQPARGT